LLVPHAAKQLSQIKWIGTGLPSRQQCHALITFTLFVSMYVLFK
jgi:hypothetical protein